MLYVYFILWHSTSEIIYQPVTNIQMPIAFNAQNVNLTLRKALSLIKRKYVKQIFAFI